jgi:hypothetical protein
VATVPIRPPTTVPVVTPTTFPWWTTRTTLPGGGRNG